MNENSKPVTAQEKFQQKLTSPRSLVEKEQKFIKISKESKKGGSDEQNKL